MQPKMRGNPSRAAFIVSLAFHLGIGVSLWADVWPHASPPPEPAALKAELVQEPPRQPTPPPPAPPPKPQPVAAPPVNGGGPVAPQLRAGDLAQHSSPGQADDDDDDQADDDSPAAIAMPRPPLKPAHGKGRPTQTERDLILAQVLRHWRVPAMLRGFPKPITFSVQVLADGSLGPPYSARSPWNPAAAIDDYDKSQPGSLFRQATESLYQALRQAQPLKLPQQLLAKAPFEVRLDFRVSDVP